MNPERGYYSLIQFCPNPSRWETVNVGVVLFCPALRFLEARISKNNRRAEKLVGRQNLERAALDAAKQAIQSRLQVDRESFQTIEDLEKFINSRGNSVKLTPARPIKVFNPKADLDGLFVELVGGKSSRQKAAELRELFPTLHGTFEELQSQGKAQLNLRVTVPVLARSMIVPYAYSNGRLNLVKPQRFSQQESASLNSAERLAIEGNLVQRHGTEQDRNARLIVVSSFDDDQDEGLINRVKALFADFGVENVAKDQIDGFLARVRNEAHQQAIVA